MFKNNKILIISLLASFSCGLFAFNNKDVTVANAAVGNYLDTSKDEYYSSFNKNLTGDALLGSLHDLITSTHQTYTAYDDSGKANYQQNTDQYYDANGNKVDGYIYDFYSGSKQYGPWDNGTGMGDYSREHVWPKTLSNTLWDPNTYKNGGGADMHHIRPSNISMNSARNNNRFGLVSDFGLTYNTAGKAYAKDANSVEVGLGGYFDASKDVFEPIDTKKGDAARIILYLYTHYNTYSNFGNYAKTNGSGSSTFFGTLNITSVINTKEGSEEAAFDLLVDWSESDPVDDIERRRNDQVAIYQGNRNPYIDYPQWVNEIWGDGTDDTPVTPDPEEPDTPVTPDPEDPVEPDDPINPDDLDLPGGNKAVDPFITLADDVTTGDYIITAYADSTYQVMDASLGYNSDVMVATAYQDYKDATNAAFTFTKNGDGFYISGADFSLGYGTGTSFNKTKELWYLSASGDKTNIIPNDDNARNIQFRSNYNFRVYAQSSKYNVPYLYKVDEAIKLFVDYLQKMDCLDMSNKEYRDALTYLYGKLTNDQLSYISTTQITCNNGKNYTILEAYNYALTRAVTKGTSSFNSFINDIDDNSLMLIISLISIIGFTVGLSFKKRRIKSR